MTVDELKQIAGEMGYNIIKKQEYVRFLPCKCGCNKRERWFGFASEKAYIFRCVKCGVEAQGRTEKEAKLNWNRMMEEE